MQQTAQLGVINQAVFSAVVWMLLSPLLFFAVLQEEQQQSLATAKLSGCGV